MTLNTVMVLSEVETHTFSPTAAMAYTQPPYSIVLSTWMESKGFHTRTVLSPADHTVCPMLSSEVTPLM